MLPGTIAEGLSGPLSTLINVSTLSPQMDQDEIDLDTALLAPV